MAGGGPDGNFQLPFASLGGHPGCGAPRRSVRLQKKRAAVANAEAAASGGVNPLDLLPLEAWEMVAQELCSVQDLWALTGSCRVLRPLREDPELVEWRRLRVGLAQQAHECSVRLRDCQYNTPDLFAGFDDYEYSGCDCRDEYGSDADDYCCDCSCGGGGGGPPDGFLAACVPYAWANVHKCIKGSPWLAWVLGPDGCAAMETAKDAKAEEMLIRWDDNGWFDHIGDFLGPDGDWIWAAVDPLERMMGLMMEAGFAPALLEVLVPVDAPPWHLEFADATERPMQPLGTWLQAHKLQLGAPLVAAVREKCKAVR